jgi:acyl carrier protein
MERAALRQILHELLEAHTESRLEYFEDDLALREGLDLDSVDLVSLVSELQGRFDIQLPAAEIEKVVGIGDLLDLLQTELAAKRPAA